MSIDPLYLAIGARIRALRKQWFMSAGALATKTKLPIGRYEMGLEVISIPALFAIAKVLCCPVSWLLPDQAPKNEEALESSPAQMDARASR